MEYHGSWIDDHNSIHHLQSEHLSFNQTTQSEVIGDGMIIPKQNTITRIYCQNTNGISVGHNSDLEVVLEQVRHMEIDILIITETNLATDKSNVRAKMYDKFQRTFGQATHRLVTATSPQEYPGHYKPGGVMGAVVGKTIARVQASGHDPIGRWVYIKLIGKNNKRITIIGTYQVCQENVMTSGPTTAITQQYSTLRQEGRHNPHRVRDHHTNDLVKFVKSLQKLNEKVIVCGDL
jgi:exonuclease III